MYYDRVNFSTFFEIFSRTPKIFITARTNYDACGYFMTPADIVVT